MYKSVIRPLLFCLNPEIVHKLVVFLTKVILGIPGMMKIFSRIFTYTAPELEIEISGLKFPGRVTLAAGFDKNACFFEEFASFGFSCIEVGTITPMAQSGNPRPRLFRLVKDKALINRMGFNNNGVEAALVKLKKRSNKIIVGGNIGKNTATATEDAVDDYVFCFEKLYDAVDYFTINVSCPNVAGMEKIQDSESLREILVNILHIRSGKSTRKPVFLKISPDLSKPQIDEVIDLYHETGFDGIIATNTTTARNGLATRQEKITKIGAGGLSGKPLIHKSLELISYICKQSHGAIPLIGVGGIMDAHDALEMIKAGALLVQVYTGFIYEGPFLAKKINKAIHQYLLQTD
jgi:dihydroorotate dehydrogenase